MPPHPLRLTNRDSGRPGSPKDGVISRKVARLIGAVVNRWYPDRVFCGRSYTGHLGADDRRSDPARHITTSILVLGTHHAPPAPVTINAQRDAEKDAALVLLNAVAANPRQRAKVRIAGDKWDGAPEGDWILTIERAPASGKLTTSPKPAALPPGKDIS